jgi:probable HAF family extracellular repeat protein
MKSRPCNWMSFACLAAALTITIQLPAQGGAPNNNQQPRYRLVEIATFGGPESFATQGPPLLRVLNSSGTAVGFANTPASDPYYPNCILNCYVIHGFQWQNGVLTDLGALPDVNSSAAFGVNESGLVAGVSENGSIDPLTGYPEEDAVVWERGRIENLGTLGGNNSIAFALDDWGQVVGAAANAIPDQYAFGQPYLAESTFPVAQQSRAFLWQNGTMHDLGTLGGNDAAAGLVNDLGMIGGTSYTNTTPNPTTGLPTMDPFVWVGGRMLDLGTLGNGHFSYPNWMNIWGQTVGNSAPADTWYHAFLWSGGRMQDLGLPLGGDFSTANWVSDVGEVVGDASLPGDQTYHAVLWRQGRATDLGVVSGYGCSVATSINLVGQIVGLLVDCNTGEQIGAFLWENGTMYDLNTLISPGSGLSLIGAFDINNLGEIVGQGRLPSGEIRAAVLILCGGDAPGNCQNQVLGAGENTNKSPRPAQQVKPWRDPMARFRAPIYSR